MRVAGRVHSHQPLAPPEIDRAHARAPAQVDDVDARAIGARLPTPESTSMGDVGGPSIVGSGDIVTRHPGLLNRRDLLVRQRTAPTPS